MCGNQVSSVSNPNGDFYQMVVAQIASKKVVVKNYPISIAQTSQLSSVNLAGIRELCLQKCQINHQTMQHISQINMPALSKLSLNDNQLGPIGCRILSGSALLSNLTELSLNNNKIKDVGLKALTNAELQFIEDLSLNDNALTTDSLKAMAGKLESIECLSLGGNKFNDSSVAALNAINPQGIYFLKLSRNEITDEGLKQLIKGGKNLDVLLIERNKIKESKDKFKKKDLFLFY